MSVATGELRLSRIGQHDDMVVGRNEIGVQNMISVFAQQLGVAL